MSSSRTSGFSDRHSGTRSRLAVQPFIAGAAPPPSLLRKVVAAQGILPSNVSVEAHSGPSKTTPAGQLLQSMSAAAWKQSKAQSRQSEARSQDQQQAPPTEVNGLMKLHADQEDEAVEVVEGDDDNQPRVNEPRVAGTVEELATEAKGFQLHMSDRDSATGYKHVFRKTGGQSGFRAFLKVQGRVLVLGNDFASQVDAAVAVAQHLQQQQQQQQESDGVEEERMMRRRMRRRSDLYEFSCIANVCFDQPHVKFLKCL